MNQLLKDQQLAGHDVSVVYSSMRDDPEVLRVAFGPSINLIAWSVGREISVWQDVQAAQSLNRILHEISPDIVHLHCSKAGFVGRFVCRARGLPAIYSPHGISMLRRDISFFTRALYFVLEAAAALTGIPIVACSADELRSLRWLPADSLLFPNSVNVNEITKGGTRVANGNTDVFRVAICGRITVARAPERIARIAASAPDGWEFWWIGDGEIRSVLDNSRVQILGWKSPDEVLHLLSQADVLLPPSHWEGMSMAVLEAMSLRLPVVASDIVGNRALVQHGVTGFLVSDDAQYLPSLCKIASDSQLRHTMGEAGQKRISDNFNALHISAKWRELYETIYSSANAAS